MSSWKVNREARRRGFIAFYEGKKESDNPYDVSAMVKCQWDTGFRQARELRNWKPPVEAPDDT